MKWIEFFISDSKSELYRNHVACTRNQTSEKFLQAQNEYAVFELI